MFFGSLLFFVVLVVVGCLVFGVAPLRKLKIQLLTRGHWTVVFNTFNIWT